MVVVGLVEQETVRAVVEAYGAGEIELPPRKAGTPDSTLRYARTTRDERPTRPYAGTTIAEFLNWHRVKVKNALTATDLIDEGILEEKRLVGLSPRQARSIVEAANATKRRMEMEAAAKERQAKEAEERAKKLREEAARKEKEAKEAAAREANAAEEKARKKQDARKKEEEARRAKQAEDRKCLEAVQARLKQEAEAAEERRRREAEAAKKAREERAEKERKAKLAQERKVVMERKAEAQKKEAKRVSRSVAATVRAGFRTGRATVRTAASMGRDAERAARKGPPKQPTINKFLDTFALRCDKLFTAREKGDLYAKTQEMVEFAAHAGPRHRRNLAKSLRKLVGRVSDLADRIEGADEEVEKAGVVVDVTLR